MRKFEAKRETVVTALAKRLSEIGELCVKKAREDHPNNWGDRTGNLRSSIGYTVLYNGRERYHGAPRKVLNGSEGITKCNTLLKDVAAKYPQGLVLVVCAGMNYAVYVEAVHHKDVLTGAELVAERLVKTLAGYGN